MFDEKYADEIQAILTKYPPEQRRAAVMPLLHLAQRDQMYVTRQAMTEIADILGISSTDVASILGFYTLYYDQPAGTYRVQGDAGVGDAGRAGDEITVLAEEVYRHAVFPHKSIAPGLMVDGPKKQMDSR